MDLRLIEPFIKSTKNMIKEMTKIDVDIIGEPYADEGDMESFGVASIINFAGKMRGRFLIDITPELANEMVYSMLEEKLNSKDRLYVSTISEINNIISGDANTVLNNTYSLGLRLAPPIVFTGKNIIIAASRINSASILGNTKYGKIKLNIGFQEVLN